MHFVNLVAVTAKLTISIQSHSHICTENALDDTIVTVPCLLENIGVYV